MAFGLVIGAEHLFLVSGVKRFQGKPSLCKLVLAKPRPHTCRIRLASFVCSGGSSAASATACPQEKVFQGVAHAGAGRSGQAH